MSEDLVGVVRETMRPSLRRKFGGRHTLCVSSLRKTVGGEEPLTFAWNRLRFI